MAVSSRMPHLKPILLAGLLVAMAGVWLLLGLRYGAEYNQFQSQSSGYYAQLAESCGAMLHEHPAPFLGLSSDAEWPGWFRLPDGAALPASIKALRPDIVRVSTNSAYVGFRRSATFAWGIVWFRHEDKTNCWALESVGAGERVLYVKNVE